MPGQSIYFNLHLSALDPAYRTFLASCGVAPAGKYYSGLSQFFKDIRAIGALANTDFIYIFAQDNQTNSKLNLVAPGTFTATEVNSPAWTAGQGFTGNGSTSYLNTGLTPSTGGLKGTLTSSSMGVYSRTNSAVLACDMGVLTSNVSPACATTLFIKSGDNNRYGVMGGNNSVAGTHGANTDSLALQSQAVSGGVNTGYRRGVSFGTHTNVGYSLPNANLYIGANNSLGSPASHSPRQFAMAFYGNASFSQLNLYNAIQKYMVHIGTSV